MELHIPFLILAFLGSIVSSAIGFGSGLIIIVFGSLFFDIKSTIFLGTIFFLFITVNKVIMFRKSIDWYTVKWIVVGGIPLTILGSYFMITAPTFLLEKLLGAIVLLYSLVQVFKKNKEILLVQQKAKPWYLVLGGSLWGFCGGIIGVGNPVKAMVLDNLNFTKEVFAGTMAMASLTSLIAKMYFYTQGTYEMTMSFEMAIALMGVGFIGLQIGKQFITRISPSGFKKTLTYFLGIIGIYLLGSDIFW